MFFVCSYISNLSGFVDFLYSYAAFCLWFITVFMSAIVAGDSKSPLMANISLSEVTQLRVMSDLLIVCFAFCILPPRRVCVLLLS